MTELSHNAGEQDPVAAQLGLRPEELAAVTEYMTTFDRMTPEYLYQLANPDLFLDPRTAKDFKDKRPGIPELDQEQAQAIFEHSKATGIINRDGSIDQPELPVPTTEKIKGRINKAMGTRFGKFIVKPILTQTAENIAYRARQIETAQETTSRFTKKASGASRLERKLNERDRRNGKVTAFSYKELVERGHFAAHEDNNEAGQNQETTAHESSTDAPTNEETRTITRVNMNTAEEQNPLPEQTRDLQQAYRELEKQVKSLVDSDTSDVPTGKKYSNARQMAWRMFTAGMDQTERDSTIAAFKTLEQADRDRRQARRENKTQSNRPSPASMPHRKRVETEPRPDSKPEQPTTSGSTLSARLAEARRQAAEENRQREATEAAEAARAAAEAARAAETPEEKRYREDNEKLDKLRGYIND